MKVVIVPVCVSTDPIELPSLLMIFAEAVVEIVVPRIVLGCTPRPGIVWKLFQICHVMCGVSPLQNSVCRGVFLLSFPK